MIKELRLCFLISVIVKRAWNCSRRIDLEIPQLGYLMRNFDKIVSSDFIPSDTDILHARFRTTGVFRIDFEVDNREFSLFDVGGENSEKGKWKKYFDEYSPNAIIFFCAIDEFNVTWNESDSEISKLSVRNSIFLINRYPLTCSLKRSKIFHISRMKYP